MYKFTMNESAMSNSVLDLVSDYVSHCQLSSSPTSYKKCMQFVKESIEGFDESKMDAILVETIKEELSFVRNEVKKKLTANYLKEQAKHSCF